MDLGIEVILELFSSKGLQAIFSINDVQLATTNSQRIFSLKNEYIKTIKVLSVINI